ncbi:putative ABC transport system permease protein [Raineyella antarctica]|uniref:Putative ABC transport system permease protein n=1 Tax=Raineyella antarctica TaxID=1577474 RepID=A0A1G6HZ82_9ACTN|nr:ABC transporter permease [Raineyella antarctica]SDB99453.1 putative ABC transport system permease protein [Raineyella antarctica]
MIVALDLGLVFAVMALGVYISFRILDFADLTVDGSFTTGAATAAALIVSGVSPWLATVASIGAGLVAGSITGLLHAKGGINPLLAGILTQIALYSINLRIMGRANVPLLRAQTIMSPLRDARLLGTPVSVLVFLGLAVIVAALLVWLLSTDMGLAMQATGDNESMIRSLGVNTDAMKIFGLALSNGLVALCGALIAQYQGFADIGMGIGLIVAGLASVIIGQAIFGQRTVLIAASAVVVGSVVYRVVIQIALMVGLNPNDMKLISAVLVVVALLLPKWDVVRRYRNSRQERLDKLTEPFDEPEPVAIGKEAHR